MAEIYCYVLILLIAMLLIYVAGLSPVGMNGVKQLICANNIVVSLYAIYIVLSSCLPIIADNFEYTWAPIENNVSSAAWALSLSLFALAVYAIVYSASRDSTRLSHTNEHHSPNHTSDSISLGLILWALLIGGIAVKLWVVVRFGGVAGAITQMSGGLRESLGIQATEPIIGVLRSFSTCADFAASYLLIESLRLKRRTILFLIIFLAVSALTYLTAGKRTVLVEYLLIAALGTASYRWNISIRYFPYLLFGGLAFGWMTLWVRSFLAATLNGLEINVDTVPWSHGSILGMYLFSLEFAFFETLVLCVERSEEIVNLFGGSLAALYTTQIEPVLLLVPRAIWEGKPEFFYDLSHGIGVIMFQQSLDDVAAGIAPSYIGTSWVLGGWLGLTLFSAMLGFLAAKGDSWYWARSRQVNALEIQVYAFSLFSVFVLWRQGGLGYSLISLVVGQLGHVIALCYILLSSGIVSRNASRAPKDFPRGA